MLLATLVVLCTYTQAGVGQSSDALDPNTPMILNNSSVRFVMENQCVTRQQVQQIVQEAFQAERQIRQAEQDALYTRI